MAIADAPTATTLTPTGPGVPSGQQVESFSGETVSLEEPKHTNPYDMDNESKMIIFDTSGINALADDSDCISVIRGLQISRPVGVTDASISEIIANANARRRHQLLDVLGRLLKFGICFFPPHKIVEVHARAYLEDRQGYDWRRVSIRCTELEDEVVRRSIVDEISEETRVTQAQTEKKFKDNFAGANKIVKEQFSGRDDELSQLNVGQLAEGGALREQFGDQFEKITGTRITQDEIGEFVERCLPIKVQEAAFCVNVWDYIIRNSCQRSLGRAGRTDTLSAMYLPYCSVFVTNDRGQWETLRAATSAISDFKVDILMYVDFKKSVCGIDLAAGRLSPL